MKKKNYGYLLFISPSLFFHGAFASNNQTSSVNKDWSGLYVGAKAGIISSKFKTNTTTNSGTLLNNLSAKLVNQVGQQEIDNTGFLSGVVGGYNWIFNKLLIGLEANIQSSSTNGESHTGAIPYPDANGQYVITSYGNSNWLFTASPRVGLLSDNWLFYTTAGFALANVQSDFIFTDSLGVLESKRVKKNKPGYLVGAGIETNLTSQISLNTEYVFTSFAPSDAADMNQTIPAGQYFTNNSSMHANSVSMGLNYHFSPLAKPHTVAWINPENWQSEVGGRVFFSTGNDGAPQPLLNSSNFGDQLASRLIFSGLSAITEEVFARFEHLNGMFIKGYLGAGTVRGGQLNDEDFPAPVVYSNTLSNVRGNTSYFTLDLGYSFIKTLYGTMSLFAGYNYYAQNLNAYSCEQLAGAPVCVPSSELKNFLGISQDDQLHSLRLGLNSQLVLLSRLSLIAEATYMPVVTYTGLDIHNARELLGPEQSSAGDGAMLEAILNYQLNDLWNIGIGGRYWMWNMHNGSVLFDFLGETGEISEPARFNANRYGMFVQLKYQHIPMENRQDSPTIAWQGLFLGGHLGGAWGQSTWSDPFKSSYSGESLNYAGFGNMLDLTGPLGGIDLYRNWQTNRLVYGIGAAFTVADIRGENTLFSGIGGINGQIVSNYLGTLFARIGTPFNRSLVYIDSGPAVLNTRYKINGNTGALSLGVSNLSMSSWGWMGGFGVTYALNDRWHTTVDYNYIYIPNQSVSMNNLPLVNQHVIDAKQKLNVFKLGLSYQFDLSPNKTIQN